MPTILPRVNVTFQDRETYEKVEHLTSAKTGSLSDTVQGLVTIALELIEDIALADLGRERLARFDPEKSIDIEQVIAWNDKRKPRRFRTKSK